MSAPPLKPIEMKAVAPAPSPEPEVPVRTQLASSEPTVAPEPNEPAPVPTTVSPPSSPPPRLAPSKSPLPPRDVPGEDDEPLSWLDRLRNLDFGSALTFLCFSVALLFASFDGLELVIKPLAALGLLVGLLGGTLPALWQRRNAVFPLILSILCLVELLFLGSWPHSSPPPPRLVTVPLHPDGMAVHQAAGEDDWVDAFTNAVRRGDVRVEVVSVQIGPVELKGKSSVAASPERYLTIRLRVSYEGVIFQQTPYEPWADLTEAPSKHAPTLTDNQGRTYKQTTFHSGWKVAGRADIDALNPGHQVKEVLVYPVPARDVEHLRLLLPASAFGLEGAFRFHIPRSVIRGL